MVCTGPVTCTGQEAIGRDIANLRAAMEAEGVQHGFLPVVAPASCFPTLIDEHYGSEPAALMGIAEALREEYRAIVDAGLQVQIDDAFIPFMYDVLSRRARWRTTSPGLSRASTPSTTRSRASPPRWSATTEPVPPASWNGPHTNDIPLRDVLPLVMQVNAGMYLFENANPRHEHEWRVWEDVELPDDKVLAPGVISHATNVVEHPHLVAERLERIAQLPRQEGDVAAPAHDPATAPQPARLGRAEELHMQVDRRRPLALTQGRHQSGAEGCRRASPPESHPGRRRPG